MAGETIRFGLSDFENSKGFKIRNFTNFANKIEIYDIFKEMGGEENLSTKTRSTIESIFFKIAGKDGTIDKNELIQYFRELDKAAADDDVYTWNKDTLNHSELYNMEARRGNVKEQESFLGIPFNIDKETRKVLGEFIKALVNVNDNNYAQEQAYKADLESRTTYNKDGGRTVKEPDIKSEHSWNNQTQRTTTYDKDNNVIKKTYVDSNNTKHTEFFKDGHRTKEVKEDNKHRWTTTFNNDRKPIKEEAIDKKSGYISSDYSTYENGKLVRVDSESNDGYKSTKIITYNKAGQVAKEVVTEQRNGKTYQTTTKLYKDGKLSKETVNGTEERFYNSENEYEPYKKVYKDKNGNVRYSEEFTYQEGNPNPVKVVTKNAKGEVESSVLTKYSKESGNPVREEHLDKNGKTTSVTEYSSKEFLQKTKSTEYKADGSVETTVYNKGKEAKTEVKDANGNVTKQTEYFYNAQGREAKRVTKDGKGNVIETVNTTYPAKDTNRTEYRNGDETLTKAFTTKHVKNGSSTYIDEFYKDGKPLCRREHVINNRGESIVVYKNERGEEITKDEFNALKKS